MTKYKSLEYKNGVLRMLDQRKLPHEVSYVDFTDYRAVAIAIKDMVVRGAPAIGAAAAFALCLAAHRTANTETEKLKWELKQAGELIKQARPTAVNLCRAVDRVLNKMETSRGKGIDELIMTIEDEALEIAQEDVRANRAMALNGLSLVDDGARFIHHCNTGALATVDYGTALGIIRMAHEKGKKIFVYLDETRPRLQGARLSAWELRQLGIPHKVIVDSAAGYLMKNKKVDLVVVGCDRMVRNGDMANKIGTYSLAVLARSHGIPFYAAVPTSTIDMSLENGDAITIEERGAEEITRIGNEQITPEGTEVYNPAFDVTPWEYISAVVTEKGVVYPPYEAGLRRIMGTEKRKEN